jgi:hypothetical protein
MQELLIFNSTFALNKNGNRPIPNYLGRTGGFRQVSERARILSRLAGLGEIE